MKFVADEGVDSLVVVRLREAGYSVWYIVEMAAGISATVIISTLQKYDTDLPHSFTVITAQKVRIRPQLH